MPEDQAEQEVVAFKPAKQIKTVESDSESVVAGNVDAELHDNWTDPLNF